MGPYPPLAVVQLQTAVDIVDFAGTGGVLNLGTSSNVAGAGWAPATLGGREYGVGLCVLISRTMGRRMYGVPT